MKKLILVLSILFSASSFFTRFMDSEECVNRALTENISIKQAELDYLDSEIQKKLQ